MIVIWILLAYFVLVWIVLRLVIPHFSFKQALPEFVPAAFLEKIKKIDAEASDKRDFLRRCYEYVTSKYKGSRIKTVTHFWAAFKDPINQPSGFMPCTNQNYLLRLMLVKSGRFQDSEIIPRVTPLNFFIHQYLKVNVDGQSIEVDPWSAFIGVPLGKKSSIIG